MQKMQLRNALSVRTPYEENNNSWIIFTDNIHGIKQFFFYLYAGLHVVCFMNIASMKQ